MTITLSKRTFLRGLFVAPAIVAATNIMPVKAFEMFTSTPPLPDGFGMRAGIIQPIMAYQDVGKSQLITDIAEIQEASATHLHNEWKLIEIAGGERRWLKGYTVEQLKFQYKTIKTLEVPATPREIDTTVALMKDDPGSAVIWELPTMMQKGYNNGMGRKESST